MAAATEHAMKKIESMLEESEGEAIDPEQAFDKAIAEAILYIVCKPSEI